jgi:hypothetical protein
MVEIRPCSLIAGGPTDRIDLRECLSFGNFPPWELRIIP